MHFLQPPLVSFTLDLFPLLEFLLLAELCICPGTFPSSTTYLLASWVVTTVSWGLLPSQQ